MTVERVEPVARPAATEATAARHVVVAILTYRRAHQLARVLPPLLRQVRDLTAMPAQLLVVDNDPDAGAAAAVAAYGPDVTYVHEPEPGIAAARNAALRAAGNAAAIVFIDDDEVPESGWLSAMVEAWRAWGCAGVAGPVRRTFTEPPAAWVMRSGFFATKIRPSGLRVQGAATSNLLLDLDSLRAARVVFDERFGLTGGEDTLLTRSMSRDGYVIRWCPEAQVIDPVPAERATREWILRRAFRAGTTWSRVHLVLRARERGRLPRPMAVAAERVELTCRAFVQVGRAAGSVASSRLLGGGGGPAAECRFASGAGMLVGAWGARYEEYRRAPR